MEAGQIGSSALVYRATKASRGKSSTCECINNTTTNNKMVKTGQFTTNCKGNKVIGVKQQISFC